MRSSLLLSTVALLLPAGTAQAERTAPPVRELAPGVSYRTLRFVEKPSHGDGQLHVVRIDPKKARLLVVAASARDGRNRTAGQWAEELGALAVINAGMYETDHSTHTGLLRIGEHANNGGWVKAYRSLLQVSKSGARIRDVSALPKDVAAGDTVVQNLRLIAGPGKLARPGKNVWKENGKAWSEAAIAMDRDGNILFLFLRSPMSMHAFNNALLRSDLRITHAQHAEGGPEASLSVRGAGLKLDFAGSFETGFNENDDNREQWLLPNVLAVLPR